MTWFDEPVDFLRRAIRTTGEAGMDVLVALDGSYALMENPKASSPPSQHKVIQKEAARAGLELVLAVPAEPWPTEMDKRTAAFDIALSRAEVGRDWFFVLDADYELHASPDFRRVLGLVETDVGLIRVATPPGPGGSATHGPPPVGTFRSLFRAQKITVGPNHFTYKTEDGRVLFGLEFGEEQVPAFDFTGLLDVVHYTYHRPKARVQRQFDYYRARDKAAVEFGTCAACGQRQARTYVPRIVERLEDGRAAANQIEVCEVCHPDEIIALKAKARELDLDLDQVEAAIVKLPS